MISFLQKDPHFLGHSIICNNFRLRFYEGFAFLPGIQFLKVILLLFILSFIGLLTC